MRKALSLVLSVLIILSGLIGCSTDSAPEQDTSFATANSESTSEAAANPTILPTVDDVAVPTADTSTPAIESEQVAIVTPTPEPTEVPTPTPKPTDVPTPVPTPEPNPYAGVWTIEDLPFSLELRSDKTYLVTATEQEREGTYTFDANRIVLDVGNGQSMEMRYYENADVLKIDDFKLIRDDLVFFYETTGVPVSFTAENEDASVSVRNAVVEVKMKDGKQVQSYCFIKAGLTPSQQSRDWFDAADSGEPTDSFNVYKYDGNYSLWMRDPEGNPYQSIDVTVISGFRYPVQAEGLDYVRQPVSALLKEKGTSVDEMNRIISRDVAAAGIYTRTGVVTAGVSLISNMAKYGYTIVYQGHGAYQAARNWGLNPYWGAKLDNPTTDPNGTYYYTGMQCVASIVWAYKQAGMNLSSEANSEIGTLGERTRAKDNRIDYDRAESGDIVKSGGHYLMVIDRLDRNGDGVDDAYLTYEMWAPHLTMLILPFSQIRGREFFSMDAYFDGTGRNARKVFYWKNTFRIPYDVLPQYLRDAVESEKLEQSYAKLLQELGF